MMTQAQYVALTTHGGGWWVELVGEPGEGRDGVEQRALREIAGDKWDTLEPLDIYQDTERKNLVVVSKSKAERNFRRAWGEYQDRLLYGEE